MVAAPVVTAPVLVMMFVFLQLQGLANHWAGELKRFEISVKNESENELTYPPAAAIIIRMIVVQNQVMP